MAKTIVENSTNISKYLFADDKPVIMGSDKLTVGSDPVDFYVADLNSSNSTMHTGWSQKMKRTESNIYAYHW